MDSYELALELGRRAKRRGVTVATAESCTAGGLGFEITVRARLYHVYEPC